MEPGAATAGAFFDLKNLLTQWNVLLIMGAWFLIVTLKKMAPDFFATKLGGRVLPLLPIAITTTMVWIPGPWMPPTATWGEKLVLGLVLGACTANAHTVLKRFGVHAYLPGLRAKRPNDA